VPTQSVGTIIIESRGFGFGLDLDLDLDFGFGLGLGLGLGLGWESDCRSRLAGEHSSSVDKTSDCPNASPANRLLQTAVNLDPSSTNLIRHPPYVVPDINPSPDAEPV
jgi:hypothetical protein